MSPPTAASAERQQSIDEQRRRQHNNASASSASSSFSFCWTYSVGLICWTLPVLLWDGIRLLCFVILLLPGFVRFGWYYWFASKRKSVRYNDQSCRQTLDIYLPTMTTTRSAKTHRYTTTRRRPSSPSSVAERGFSSSARRTTSSAAEDDDSPASMQEPLLMAQQLEGEGIQQEPSGGGGGGGGGGGVPVLIFVTGGAWMIGYKMWGALLARCLTATGCMVVIPDYRNFFPTMSCGGKKNICVEDMVDDVTSALNWLRDNVADYGGNPDRFVLCGQSAGGHLAMMTLLQNAATTIIAEGSKGGAAATAHQRRRPNKLNFDVPQVIRGVICLSSPFDLRAMLPTFARHGMTEPLIRDEMFGGHMRQYDPVQWVRDYCNCGNSRPPQQEGEATTTTAPPPLSSPRTTATAEQQLRRDQRASSSSLKDALPPIRLYHGGADRTVPHDSMTAFHLALRQAGVARVQAHSYPNCSHTHAILEGPMDADHAFHKHVFAAVKEWTTTTTTMATSTTITTMPATTAASEDDEPTRTVHQDDASSTLQWPDEDAPVLQRLCPHVLCQLAHHVNPF